MDGARRPPAVLAPRALLEILDEELLGQLVGLPVASISQAAEEGQTADRLAWISQVVSYLQGAYSNGGIRRWFTRPRAQLDGRSPLEALGPGWRSDAGPAAIALRLAKELV